MCAQTTDITRVVSVSVQTLVVRCVPMDTFPSIPNGWFLKTRTIPSTSQLSPKYYIYTLYSLFVVSVDCNKLTYPAAPLFGLGLSDTSHPAPCRHYMQIRGSVRTNRSLALIHANDDPPPRNVVPSYTFWLITSVSGGCCCCWLVSCFLISKYRIQGNIRSSADDVIATAE